MALLGDDGRGYELARKLESQGVWRSWLGDDSMYANFAPFLSSPSSWESFMRTDDTKSRAQIQLQLLARALLFDKACVSLFPRSNRSSSSSNSKLNPNYLQLHGDDVYYTVENPTQNVAQPSKVQSKSSFGVGSRYGVHEDDSMSQRIPESWYSQFFEKYRATKPYRLPSGDRESEKRTPEQMSNYLRIVEKHKRRRAVFMEEQNMGSSNSMFDKALVVISSHLEDDDESLFFPETTFLANSVPDSALPPSNQMDNVQNVKCNGVLDNLPPIMTKSPIMLERLGIRPEYLNMEQTGNHERGRSGSFGMKNNLSPEQAAEMSRKIVSRLLMDVGFDRASGGPLDIFGQLFGSHISKLGRILKVLSDGYKECSAIELLKMFLQTIGHGNLAAFAEVVKDSTKNNVQQQSQMQQVQAMQSQLQLQNQTSVRLPHQFPRQMHNQMVHPLQQQQQQQMVHPLQQQQQWDRMRRRQPSTSRPVMNMGGHMNVDSESQSQSQRSMVEVKLENPPEFPMDNNAAAFATLNYRNPQMQFRQQQFASISAFQAQSNNQFRPMASVQIPQLQPQAHSPNMGLVRAPPVKVEAFQELMGGDSSMKHDSDETKLTSPK
ncbi:hypothetical protein L1987_18573 [Smallanthus sonchifolius]|uniref:Uncharacterized protein n=1 Tax=Smallanthus sonchifolius TaxID=185202 RepID=A0ACB9J1M9_9ASTR|nr:hypothetical protein L1987_18573 [Smallanthus sonchifolius]